MKKVSLLVAIMAMAVFVSCAPQQDPVLNGTWIDDWGVETWFDNGNFEVRDGATVYLRGTYTARGGEITLNIVQMNMGDGLVTLEELRESFVELLGLLSEEDQAELDEYLSAQFLQQVQGTYSVSGDELTLVTIFNGEETTEIFTRL